MTMGNPAKLKLSNSINPVRMSQMPSNSIPKLLVSFMLSTSYVSRANWVAPALHAMVPQGTDLAELTVVILHGGKQASALGLSMCLLSTPSSLTRLALDQTNDE